MIKLMKAKWGEILLGVILTCELIFFYIALGEAGKAEIELAECIVEHQTLPDPKEVCYAKMRIR